MSNLLEYCFSSDLVVFIVPRVTDLLDCQCFDCSLPPTQFEYWYLLVNMVLQVWSNILSFVKTGRYTTMYSVFIMLNWYSFVVCVGFASDAVN
jgi:hypothetical protein